MQPEHVTLLLQLWERQRRARARATDDARRAERAALQAAEQHLPPLEVQPAWVPGAPLLPHQLAAASWLRTMWLQRRAAVLADDQGLGKTASVAAYIASLVHEFVVTSPVLVVAPAAMLTFWEGASRRVLWRVLWTHARTHARPSQGGRVCDARAPAAHTRAACPPTPPPPHTHTPTPPPHTHTHRVACAQASCHSGCRLGPTW
jgi:hypothetical protein